MDYEKIDTDVYKILEDYGIYTFPIDLFDLCQKLCIDVYKYSLFESKSYLFKKKSKKGFAVNTMRRIFYNDENINNENPECSQRYTIGHEIYHIYDNCDDSNKNDSRCEHFSRMLWYPQALMLLNNVEDVYDIINFSGLGYYASSNAFTAYWHRIRYFGNDFIFRYEKDYLQSYCKYHNIGIEFKRHKNGYLFKIKKM